MAISAETSFFVALLIAVVVFIGYLEWSSAKGRLMRRKNARLAAVRSKDEAYNATVTSRAISRALKTQGYDVTEAEKLIGRADAAISMGNFSDAKRYAESARETLFAIKQRQGRHERGTGESASADSGYGKKAASGDVFTKQDERQQPGSAEKKLPKDYAEASFAISLLKDEAATAQSGGRDIASAVLKLAQAEEAFRQGKYGESLHLAIRARKEISDGPGGTAVSPAATDNGKAPSGGDEACPACGSPLRETDSFCRSCGAKIEYRCQACDAALETGDMFCGKCGAKVR
ncbi:MAG: zinc ribbon domain-containing protein [Candidatus Thermoplasmatota archaeon]|nr:zinc ribbon domain-containing protein [Candidatus Sysuiplasma jiujiangense]MCL4317891.1 zinc ribbon domain-containing protein [Candidatus Thermoplasmatota archaeon]MCL5254319.1 zinc ribbon domain-containing protein [Candidatus Thermoplasmatota archaeon]